MLSWISPKQLALLLLGTAILSFGMHNIHRRVGITEGLSLIHILPHETKCCGPFQYLYSFHLCSGHPFLYCQPVYWRGGHFTRPLSRADHNQLCAGDPPKRRTVGAGPVSYTHLSGKMPAQRTPNRSVILNHQNFMHSILSFCRFHSRQKTGPLDKTI